MLERRSVRACFSRNNLVARAGLLGMAAALVIGPFRGAAQETQPPQRSVAANATAGAQIFRAGKWGVFGLLATNPTAEAAKMRGAVYFADEPYRQYGRNLWVPAQALRRSWCPIRAPEEVSGVTADIRTVADDLTAGDPQRIRAPDGGLWANFSLPIDRQRAITAIITAAPGVQIPDAISEVVLAAREARNFKPYLAAFHGDFLSATVEGLGPLTQVVVAGDRPAQDAAGRAALRDWLRDGGKLWIMLDQVQPETVHLLLGDAFGYRVVDRVGLTRVEVSRAGSDGDATPVDGPRDYDVPVDFVRVLLDDGQVVHTIGGWPASVHMPYGKGQVLFTTLGPRGWLQPYLARGAQQSTTVKATDRGLVATEPLTSLAAELFAEAPAISIPPEMATQLLTEQIGYRILDRGVVMGILGGFCLAVIGAGVWLARRESMEQLGWIGPLGGAAVAVVLLLLGYSLRRSVPPTVAMLQRIDVEAGADEVAAHGAMAIYQAEPGPIAPDAIPQGLMWPSTQGLEKNIQQLIWTDLDQSHWEDLTLPAGVRLAEFHRTQTLPAPVSARGEFGSEGFAGTVVGPFQGMSDAVLIGPSGDNLSVQIDAAGKFTAALGSELAPGQFISSGLVTDQQRRRQTVYEQVFPREAGPPPRPGLALWSDPLAGFESPEGVRQTGAALVTMPLTMGRLAPGRRVAIPSAFLTYRATQIDEQVHSAAFTNSARKWVPMNFPSETWLQFQLPAEVLPFAPDEATLTIRIDAPSRVVEVLGKSAAGAEVVQSWQGPHGIVRAKFKAPELLRPDAGGGILVGIRVGTDGTEAEAPESAAVQPGRGWAIESVALDVRGQAAGASP